MVKIKGHIFRDMYTRPAKLAHLYEDCLCGSMWQNLPSEITDLIKSVEDTFANEDGTYAGLTLEEVIIKLGYGSPA